MTARRFGLAALLVMIVGLAVHNAVMATLFELGLRGGALTVVAAWKEVLLAAALGALAVDALRARRLPFRPFWLDWVVLAFAGLVLLYAVVPQDALGGEADVRAVGYALRALFVPVGAWFLGRALAPTAGELRIVWGTVLGTALGVAVVGILDAYLVPLDWWRESGAPGWFREQLDFTYRGLSGLPENLVYNTGDEQNPLRRLVSTFLGPLATAHLLTVALLAAAAVRDRAAAVAAPILAIALLLTLSRSALLALAGGFVVLAVALRERRPLALAVATVAVGVAFVALAPDLAPSTSYTAEELRIQRANAAANPDVENDPLSPDESSVSSHLRNLRDGAETVLEQPWGYGLGNAGTAATRSDVELKAGESTYTEVGVQVGVLGLALLAVWWLGTVVLLVRGARSSRGSLRKAAAAVGAGAAAVLALALQTDVLGVPWLAYVVWCLAGGLVSALPRRRAEAPPAAPGDGKASRAGRSDATPLPPETAAGAPGR